MTALLAFYKGPPRNDWRHTISHYAIRLWTWSRYSHAELVIDGWCYSSSPRDGGVRRKSINLFTGRWDVVPVTIDEHLALQWYRKHLRQGYDWAGIWRFVIPFLPQSEDRWFCFESIGAMLGFAGSHKLTAPDLHAWATQPPHAPVAEKA